MPTALERLVGKDAPLDRETRISGAILLVLGVLIAKIDVVDTLREAGRHEAHSLSISSAVGLVPLTLLLGPLMLLGGGRIVGWGKRVGLERRPDGSRSVGGWILFGLIIAPGLVLYFWLEQRLRELGYD
jgi:hypothetical protein